MPYNPNIPQPNDTFAKSQKDILNNFISIYDSFRVDHIEFNFINGGMHAKASFNEQSTTPLFAGNMFALYAIEPTLPLPETGRTELVLHNQMGLTFTQTLITGRQAAATGWTLMPSGILIKWGVATITGLNAITFPVSNAIPVFTNVYNAQVCIVDSATTDINRNVIVSSLTTTDLNVFVTTRTTTGAATADVSYFVIGV